MTITRVVGSTGSSNSSSSVSRIIDVTAAPYNAVGNGTTNDQTALAAALAALTPGDTLLIPTGKVFAHNSTLTLAASGVTVRGGGEIKATSQTAAAFIITGSDVLVEGITFSLASRTGRLDAMANHNLVLDGSGGGAREVVLRRCVADGAAGVGIFMFGAQDYLLDSCTVSNTGADGIHNTLGSQRGVIRDCRVNSSGDDGVAVVSYDNETLCADITCENTTVTTPAARGLSVVGGTRIRFRGCEVTNSAAAGVIVACETSFTSHPVTDTVIEQIRLVGCNTAGATIAHGSVLVVNDRAALTHDNITIRDIVVKNTHTSAPWAVGALNANSAPVTNLRFEDIRVQGTGPQTFSTNLAASAYTLSGFSVGQVSQGWELLGQFKSTSAFATSGAITIEQRDMLMIVVRILGQSATARPALRFNGDTGSNYWNRFTLLGGAYTEVNATGTMAFLSNIDTAAVRVIEATIANNAVGWQKPIGVKQGMAAPNGDPEAGNPSWNNTTTAITSVTLLNDGSGVTFGAHSGIMIFGRNFN